MRSCKSPTTHNHAAYLCGHHWLSQTCKVKHKCDGHTRRNGEKYSATGENGETIKIGTVVQHPFARPPHIFFFSFFFFTACPMRIPVGLRETMPWSTKRRGRGETKFHLAHSETAEGSFSTECWVQRKNKSVRTDS